MVREGGAGLGAVGGQGSDERDEGDVARAGEEAGDGGGATHAFGAVGGGEAQVAVERDAEVVAIHADDLAAGVEETAFDGFGDGRLARAGEAREPDDRRRVAGAGAAFGAGDLAGRRVGLRDGVEDDAAAVDASAFLEGKTTRDRALVVQVEGDVAGGADDHFADRVARDAVGLLGLEGRGVGHLDDLRDDRVDVLGEQAQAVGLVLDQRFLAQPEDAGAEFAADAGLVGGVRGHLAAFDEDLLGERHAGGTARADDRAGLGARPVLEGTDRAAPAAGLEDELVARADGAGFDAAGDDAAMVEAVDVGDRQAQGQAGEVIFVREGVEGFGDRRTLPPGHLGGALDDVLAVLGGDRDEVDGGEAERLQEGRVFGDDLPVGGLGVVDEVHLVHQHHQLLHAQEGEQEGVAAGLVHDAFLGVDEQECGGGAGGAGHHVLEELLVARGVDDRVGALLRAEEDARRVDGDVLFLLFDQGVEEERVFELHAFDRAVLADLLHLAVGQGVGVMEEAADEGGLAVVDVADDDDVHLAVVFDRGLGGAHRLGKGLGVHLVGRLT